MAEVERESLEVDVLFVGAGPGTLASALHLVKPGRGPQREGGEERRQDRSSRPPSS